jgi:Fe-S-cluster containining protein
MLLDAYFTIDQGVHKAIAQAMAKGRSLACARGCSTCCKSHTTIPIYPLEIAGIYWYATEKLSGELHTTLRQQLLNHQEYDACPFLVEGICSIHAMRPIACRQFNVFDQVCSEGEDAFYSRRQDVMTPIKKYSDDAFFTMLPFYGVKEKLKRRKLVKQGYIHKHVRVIREVEWEKLAERMTPGEAQLSATTAP